MKPSAPLAFLRPYLYREVPAVRGATYLQFHSRSSRLGSRRHDNRRPKDLRSLVTEAAEKRGVTFDDTLKDNITFVVEDDTKPSEAPENVHFGQRENVVDEDSTATDSTPEYVKLSGPKINRVAQLRENNALHYPRIREDQDAVTCAEFIARYQSQKDLDDTKSTLRGRVAHIRKSGSKLVFLDIVQDGRQVQISCNLGKMSGLSTPEGNEMFRKLFGYLARGDIISATGKPILEENGTLSLLTSCLPTILTPSIAPIPFKIEDNQTRMRKRHVDMLVHPSLSDTLRFRSHIIQNMRQFFLDTNFLEVQTPILASSASGAIARPFTTSASEFPSRRLAMRIAPEIWLKRLVIGGFDRVFEIGPAFRNEGLDGTHNPEFTTCEFYKAYASLDELMSITEDLISRLVKFKSQWRSSSGQIEGHVSDISHGPPYKRLQFIPTVESALGEALPTLHKPTAFSDLFALFSRHSLPLPSQPTLPKLLDKLCSLLIEPHCQKPTFITHHPSLLAPLSKQTYDARAEQYVSLRAELFVQHKEVANMYEEENSPFAQYTSFLSQSSYKEQHEGETEADVKVDESYIRALEYGLPPTGGWGAGVDRLVMLLAGRDRISDVLTFGNLRNVVGLGDGES